jgi:hypothetical protein
MVRRYVLRVIISNLFIIVPEAAPVMSAVEPACPKDDDVIMFNVQTALLKSTCLLGRSLTQLDRVLSYRSNRPR